MAALFKASTKHHLKRFPSTIVSLRSLYSTSNFVASGTSKSSGISKTVSGLLFTFERCGCVQQYYQLQRYQGFASDSNTRLVEKLKRVEIMQDLTAEDERDESEGSHHLRPKLRVSDVLNRIEPKKFTIDENTNIVVAIDHLMDEKLASCLTTNSGGEITGIITARDLLHFVRICLKKQREGQVKLSEVLSDTKLKKIITSKDHLIYCSPRDSLKRCREIMFQCKGWASHSAEPSF